MADNEVRMMMSVVPGTMSGFAAMNAGLVSINNVFTSMYNAFDQNFNLVDTILTTTSVVVTQLGVDAMESFGKFEQGMKIVQMVSGQTAQDMQYLKQQATEFSIQYRTDIDQITDGLQTLGRAGLNSASEQTEVLEAGLTTAKLEGRELNSVLEELIQNTALLGGDLKSDQFGETSEYLNDRLVATSMTAPITTHDVSETLKYSGGIAAAAGANLESEEGKAVLDDYLAAIAAFAQKGVTGSIAGTALRAFFNKPATQDSSVTDALASIHLKPEYLWEDDEETMKPISEQIGIIEKQMEKLDVSTMDRLQIWSKIVGGKMGQQMMKLHSEDIKEIKKDINGANDATDLAANSMKTYEANVKALGEAGASLQRDIGGNLVSIANPYLEFINKVLGFFDNDFMATTLAGTILTFVGYLSKKLISLISLIKSEIGTLISAMNKGINYHLGQYGRQYADEVTKSASGSSGGSGPSSSEPTSISSFVKQLYKGSSGGITLEQLRAKGMSDEAIGAWHRLGGLGKDSLKIGMSDGQVAKILLEENVLTQKQMQQLHSTLQSTTGARSPFDSTFLSKAGKNVVFNPEIWESLKQNEAAQKRLGLVIKENIGATNQAVEVDNAAVTAAKSHVNALGQEIVEEESAANSAQKKAKQVKNTSKEIDENLTLTGPKLVKTVEETDATIVNDVSTTGTAVVEDFNVMMSSIAASVSQTIPKSSTPTTNNNYIPPTYSHADPRMPNASMLPPEYYKDMEEYHRNRRAGIIGAKDTVNRWADAENKYYNPYGNRKHHEAYEDVTNEVEKRIDRKLLDNEIKKRSQSSTADSARADYYSRKVYAASGGIVGVGGLQNQIPSITAVEESLEAQKRAELQKVQYLEEGVVLEEQAVQAVSEKLMLERQAAENVVTKSIYDREKQQKLAQQAREQYAEKEKTALNLSKEHGRTKNIVENAGGGYPKNMQTSSPDQVIGKNSFGTYNEPTRTLYLPNNYYNPLERPIKQQLEVLQKSSRERADQLYGNSIYRGSKANVNDWDELKARGMQPTRRQMLKDAYRNSWISHPISSIKDSAFAQTLNARWNADRSDRFLNFGQGRIGGKINGALNLLDAVGGPWMAAMIAIPAIVNFVKGIYEGYHEDLKELSSSVKEAYSDMSSAMDGLKNAYREQNPDATAEDVEQFMLDQYSQRYDDFSQQGKWLEKATINVDEPQHYEYDKEKDDGSYKEVEEEEKTDEQTYEEAVKENTGALYEATAQLQTSMSALTTKMQDTMWGVDGISTQISDSFGGAIDKISTWDGKGSGWISEGNFLMTASQKDSNYQGYTEMAGLLLEDFHDSGGKVTQGLKTMLGTDSADVLSSMNQSGLDQLQKLANFSSGQGEHSLSRAQNLVLQQSMKNDKKSWQAVAKELAKVEVKKKSGKEVTKSDTKRLEGYIKKLATETGLDEIQIKQGAQLQQLQDMYSVAQQSMVPLAQQQANLAAEAVVNGGEINDKVTGSGEGAEGTYANAAIIASMVSVIAQAKAGEAFYQQQIAAGDEKALKAENWEDYIKQGISQKTSYGEFIDNLTFGMGSDALSSAGAWITRGKGGSYEQRKSNLKDALGTTMSTSGGDSEIFSGWMTTLETMGEYARHPDWSQAQINKKVEEKLAPYKDAQGNFKYNEDVMLKIARENYSGAILPSIIEQYMGSQLGEISDSGKGSGSGSGSGDKDKDNTGTRKERVDLVLCNRKQIPKLNVNLFKKPPSFTILNKNFKLRDVKINSEDKPKAIMAAIKNSFIDIQKRTDPKIIQDEEAIYDPNAATDGTALPSGSSKTKTN